MEQPNLESGTKGPHNSSTNGRKGGTANTWQYPSLALLRNGTVAPVWILGWKQKHSFSSGMCIKAKGKLWSWVRYGKASGKSTIHTQCGPNVVMKPIDQAQDSHGCGRSSMENLEPWLGCHPGAVMKLSYMCEHGQLGLGNLMVINKQVAMASLQLPGIIACS